MVQGATGSDQIENGYRKQDNQDIWGIKNMKI